MKKIVNHEIYGNIIYDENFFSGKKSIEINGQNLVKKDKKTFMYNDEKSVYLNGSYVMGVSLTFDDETIEIISKPKWYEIAVSIIPFLIILIWANSVALCNIIPVVGGALGGAISGLLSFINLLLIRNSKNIYLKVIITIASVAVTFLICYSIASLILMK